MRAAAGAAPSYARMLGRGLSVFALLAGIGAVLLDSEPRNAVWVNALAILAFVGMERVAARLWPGRAVSLLRATLFVAVAGNVFLVLAFFIQGNPGYANWGGRFWHADGAWLVALAGVGLHLSALLGAVVAGRGVSRGTGSDVNVWASYSRWFLLLVNGMVWVHLLLRAVLLFAIQELPPPLVYAARLYLSLYLALYVFLGMSLRQGMRFSRITAVAVLLMSLVLLLSGGRSDALYPLLFLGAGYALARPAGRATVIRWALVALPAFALAMYVGGRVRDDERGRTGEAVLERAADLSSVMASGDGRTTAVEASIRRLISDSTHSVVTRIPKEFPFENDGVVKLPGEIADRFLPRFNLSGISESETPRNWMLNDLGFLVTWSTSVELSMVADAWYRGGALGLLVVGLLLGFTFQVLENGVYRAMRRRPQASAVLLFVVPWLPTIEGRDIVAALRSVAFAAVAAMVMVAAARVLEQRKRSGRGWKAGGASARAAT